MTTPEAMNEPEATNELEATELIDRLKARAGRPQDATDTGGRAAAPPATSPDMDQFQSRLGFALPALLRRLYLEVGSGGFGPGAGLPAWPPEDAAPGDALRRARLFPLCDWGSGIRSALDCARAGGPVVRLDPNMPKADEAARVPAPLHFDRASEVKQACWVEASSLAQWLTDWLDGRALFYAAYAGPDAEDDDKDSDGEDAEDAGDLEGV